MNIAKHALALLLACTTAAFAAQDSAKATPEKIAVHAFGASDAGINKALGSKLLAELAQSGKYAEIPDHHAFQDELAKANSSSAVQVAKRRGADIVCAVSIVEVFGAYSITASMQKTSDSQVLKTASLDRSLNSLEDLSKASKDIATQLLGQPVAEAAPEPVPVAVPWNIFQPDTSAKPAPAAEALPKPKPVVALPKPKPAAALPKPVPKAPGGISSTCLAEFMFVSEKYEMAELVKELGLATVKVKAQSKAPLQFLLGPGPDDKVTDAGMTVGCLKAFPESASETQALLRDLAVYAAFKLGKDFAESAVSTYGDDEEYGSGTLSFGIRAGFNYSHLYAERNIGSGSSSGSYMNAGGFQIGTVLDIPVNDFFHIQPGIMYIRKGTIDTDGSAYKKHSYKDRYDLHYVEIPLLFSLKFSVLRLNAGPYYGICASGNNALDGNDFGLSMGFGFDISKFYMGMFYDYGLTNISGINGFNAYNRTLGFNIGVNL
ncbi:MAG: outer membrane beta-barrel protein [Fibromonadaceae bacterium]|nr:outer membrane beta-barrel protein [Fibromonadaceae bacterium]